MHTDHMQSSIQRCTTSSSSTGSAPLESLVRTEKFQSHDSDKEAPEELIESRFERAARVKSDLDSSDEVMSLSDILTLVQLSGPASLQQKLTKLLEKFQHIFSLSVTKTPAKVDYPMEMLG